MSSIKKVFGNANLTNYLLAYLFILITSVTVIVLYQYYVNAIPPPNEFLNQFFTTAIVELVAMAVIAISKNVVSKRKEVEEYE